MGEKTERKKYTPPQLITLGKLPRDASDAQLLEALQQARMAQQKANEPHPDTTGDTEDAS